MVPKLCFPSRLERAARVPGFASTRGAGSKKTVTPACPVVALFGSTGDCRVPTYTKLLMGSTPGPFAVRPAQATPTRFAWPGPGALNTPLSGLFLLESVGHPGDAMLLLPGPVWKLRL